MDQEENKGINFDLPKNRSNLIKVLGVGGGGSNAINYMFQQGIKGVDFIVSNTDAQALAESGVPTKIQLGASLTEGLGAGANPEVGEKAAQESKEEILNILSTQTKMIFITAGMGGGTGTGAAPIIAQMAKSMDILTVGIVTMPFQFEGKLRLEQAQRGLEKIKKSVDALIVINNNKLREVYGNLGFKAGFAKADEVLATAARGIAEVITHHYTQNIDLKDAKTVLTNSGTAIMGSGLASGSNRAQEAIMKALDSPLLNDNKITGCKNVLLLIVSGSDEITIDEIGEINDYIQSEAGNHTNIIMGVGEDESLGNSVSVTVIATGFGQEQQNAISNTEAAKIIHSLEEEQKVVHDLSDKKDSVPHISYKETGETLDRPRFENPSLVSSENQNPLIAMNALLEDLEVEYEVVSYPIQEGTAQGEHQDFYVNEIEEDSIEAQALNDFQLDQEPIEFIAPQQETFPLDLEEPQEHFELTSSFFYEEPQDHGQGLKSEERSSNSAVEEELPELNLELEQTDDFTTAVLKEEWEEEAAMGIFEVEETKESTKVSFSEEIHEVDQEFVFNEVEGNDIFEMKVVDPEIIAAESQIQMEFELPLDLNNAKEKINLEDELIPKFDAEKKTIKDFDEAALEIKFEIKETYDKKAEEFKQKKEQPVASKNEVKASDDTNPFDQSIDSIFAAQNEKRKAHLKAYNHKFMHQLQRVDDMERQPAYKRKGMDLDPHLRDEPSRTSLNTDSNDDLHLRSNNSFLHDNVD
ncbi:MAG: cell division protein FtsZ [Bacteroidetes bacterium]|nr:cell division protein FtsZ [Bacteroidota bacterium]